MSAAAGYRTHLWRDGAGWWATVHRGSDGTEIHRSWTVGARRDALEAAVTAMWLDHEAVKAAGVLQPPVKLGAVA